MTEASCTIVIQKPADAIWQVIRDFGAGSRYLPMVIGCTLQGTGMGALRTLTYLDGNLILERLETLDEAVQSLSYTLLSDTAFGTCLTTMVLRSLSPDQAELTWSADFQPVSLPVNEAAALMEAMLTNNCQFLKQMVEG